MQRNSLANTTDAAIDLHYPVHIQPLAPQVEYLSLNTNMNK